MRRAMGKSVLLAATMLACATPLAAQPWDPQLGWEAGDGAALTFLVAPVDGAA